MDIIGWVTATSSSLPLALVLALGGAFALLESGLGLGFFIPGETIVMLLAATFDEPWKAVLYWAAVSFGASAGDHVGYLLGRRFGSGLRETSIIARLGATNWDRAVGVLEKRGAWAVFLTRMVPVVRTLTPAAAGVAGVRYPAFVTASLAGAATWAALYVGVGYLARSSLDAVGAYLGNAGWVLGGVAVAIAIVVIVIKLVRRRHRDDDDPTRAIGAGADLAVTTAGDTGGVATLRDTIRARLAGRRGAMILFCARVVILVAAAASISIQYFFVGGILLVVALVAKPLQALLRRTGLPHENVFWAEPTLDRIAASLVAAGFCVAGVLPWQGLVLLVLPETLLAATTGLAFRGVVRLPITRGDRLRSAFQLIGMTVLAFGFAGRSSLSMVAAPVTLILVGYLGLLIGIVFSYIVAARYSRAMLFRWQRTSA